MRRGRPTPPVMLSPEERETLEAWRRRHSTSQALALRAGIVLASAAGETNTAIAAEAGVRSSVIDPPAAPVESCANSSAQPPPPASYGARQVAEVHAASTRRRFTAACWS